MPQKVDFGRYLQTVALNRGGVGEVYEPLPTGQGCFHFVFLRSFVQNIPGWAPAWILMRF